MARVTKKTGRGAVKTIGKFLISGKVGKPYKRGIVTAVSELKKLKSRIGELRESMVIVSAKYHRITVKGLKEELRRQGVIE